MLVHLNRPEPDRRFGLYSCLQDLMTTSSSALDLIQQFPVDSLYIHISVCKVESPPGAQMLIINSMKGLFLRILLYVYIFFAYDSVIINVNVIFLMIFC